MPARKQDIQVTFACAAEQCVLRQIWANFKFKVTRGFLFIGNGTKKKLFYNI